MCSEVTPVGQSVRLFHGFLEAAPDAVVIVDGDGVMVGVNSQTEKLFGYRREELLGLPVEALMPERFRGGHVGQRRTFTANPQPRSMGRGVEMYGLRSDGIEFPIDVSLSPLPQDVGILVASTIRDMTVQRCLQDELRKRTLALEEADRQKDQFLAAIAHEFRSPLSVLTNLAHILRSPKAGAAAQQLALDALGRQTTHMARLVEDLLDVSRVSRGKVSLRRETVDVQTVIASAVEMNLALVQSRKHHLEVAQFAEPLCVSGDPTRLVQVVSNLLTNAAKYTTEGGNIWLSAAREDDTIVIRIRDNGVGIPKELLTRVFDLFTQIQSAQGSRIGGLGIGLSLVRRLVELHGGTVHATSDGPGHGSEFVVRLPAAPNEPDSASMVS